MFVIDLFRIVEESHDCAESSSLYRLCSIKIDAIVYLRLLRISCIERSTPRLNYIICIIYLVTRFICNCYIIIFDRTTIIKMLLVCRVGQDRETYN